jgi:hypothetical protein
VGQHQVRDVYLDVEASYYVCHSLHTTHRAQVFNQKTLSLIPTGIATNNDCPVATKVEGNRLCRKSCGDGLLAASRVIHCKSLGLNTEH